MASWWQDRPVRAAMIAALVLRVIPMLAYLTKPCVRDECTYMDLAQALLDGKGMVGTHGWLWAPAYPALLAAHQFVFGYPGTVQITQLIVAVLCVGALYTLGRDEYGERAGRWAAWIYAVNPTMIFYTSSGWSETVYSGLLLAGVLALRWARAGGARRGWLPGVLVGLCVLFRGVATYMLPIFLLTLLWERWRERAAWAGVATCLLGAVLTVAPYSVYISRKFGEFVIADRTMGQMMWLGNNEFPPITFDYGNGTLANRTYNRVTSQGRKACQRTGDPIEKDDCETAAGIEWIKEHPGEFLERVPLRVSQLLTPHSFLTRHLRWGRWRGLPDWADEGLIVAVAVFSMATMVGGSVGYFGKAKGWYRVASGLIVLYHVAAIAVLAGLSRYRVPLEPLWLVHAGALFAAPRETVRALFTRSLWSVFGLVTIAILVVLMLRFLPAAWPSWRSW